MNPKFFGSSRLFSSPWFTELRRSSRRKSRGLAISRGPETLRSGALRRSTKTGIARSGLLRGNEHRKHDGQSYGELKQQGVRPNQQAKKNTSAAANRKRSATLKVYWAAKKAGKK